MKNAQRTQKAIDAGKFAAAKRAETGLHPRARHDEKIKLVIWFLKKFGFSTEPLLSFLTSDKTNKLMASLIKKKLVTFDLCWLNTGTVGRMAKVYKLTPSGYESFMFDGDENHQKNYFNKVRRLNQKNFKNDLVSQYYAIKEFLECDEKSEFYLTTAFTRDTGIKNSKVADFEIEDNIYMGVIHCFEIETSPKSGMELDEFVQRINALFAEEDDVGNNEYIDIDSGGVTVYPTVKIYVAGEAAKTRYSKAFCRGATFNAIEKDVANRRRSKVGVLTIDSVTSTNVRISEIPVWLNPAARGLGKIVD